jgi:hypothetical protein
MAENTSIWRIKNEVEGVGMRVTQMREKEIYRTLSG